MNRIITSFIFVIFAAPAIAQDKDASVIQQAVETKNFIFKAESVTPQRGRMRQLSPEYDVVLRPDTIISFLPYFGRAFTASINPSEGGIKFTSNSFNYVVSQKKKNYWEITIKPKDVTDVRQLYLTVFDNGRASLSVNSNNRESISFNGFIQEGNPINKKAF
ncbi:MAG: DUF4251 domain-containing protein [Chitinophagaceae bacterium]